MRYTNSLDIDVQILKVLALEKEYAQYDMKDFLKTSYRTVLRHVKDLYERELITISRLEESSKRGKEKKIWTLTFYGLMEVLKYLSDNEISSVAKLYGDRWLVLQEWQFFLNLSEQHSILLFPTLRSISKQFYALHAQRMPPFTDAEIKQMGYTRKEWGKKDILFKKIVLENIKQECTDLMLGLSFLKKRFILRHPLLSNEYRTMWLSTRSEILARYGKENPRIKRYITKRFEDEEAVHGLLCELKTQWLERGE